MPAYQEAWEKLSWVFHIVFVLMWKKYLGG